MFRRKRTQTGPGGGTAPGRVSNAGPSQLVMQASELQSVYAKVLQSFLPDAASGPGAPSGGSAPAPPGGGAPVVPPPVNAPGALTAGPLAGAESTAHFGLPGPGGASPQQMEAAQARAQAAIEEALGAVSLSGPGPLDVPAVQSRLEAMHAEGRLTADQHAALSQGLVVLAQLRPGQGTQG